MYYTEATIIIYFFKLKFLSQNKKEITFFSTVKHNWRCGDNFTTTNHEQFLFKLTNK